MGPEYRDEEDAPPPPRHIPPLTDDEDDDEPLDRNLHIDAAPDASHTSLPVPVWLRESAKTFKFQWVPLPLRKFGRAVVKWSKGPIPPKQYKVEPFFPKIQQAPIRLLDHYLPKRRHRIFLLITFYAAWLLTWSLMLKQHATSGYIKGYGKPANIWCGANFWNENNGCGLNGNNCRPFSSAYMAFRCPAECLSTHLLETRYVGNQSLRYEGLVVGGPQADDDNSVPVYRGDSFICQAAIHAGVITNANGGCGVVSPILLTLSSGAELEIGNTDRLSHQL